MMDLPLGELLQYGTPGAIIIVVVIFIWYIAKRDKQTQDKDALFINQIDKMEARHATSFKKIQDNQREHTTALKEVITELKTMNGSKGSGK